MNETNSKLELRRILLYVGITFAMTWIYCLLVIYPLMNDTTLSGVPAVSVQQRPVCSDRAVPLRRGQQIPV